MTTPLTLAFPKGRILEELQPFIGALGFMPEADFFDEASRKLMFATDTPHIRLIRVRSFDVATFVAFGAADAGVVGSDVLMEFDYPDLYAPVDLGIGRCRLSVAAVQDAAERGAESHVRVATKYPNVTRRFFAERGVQAECVKLNGAVELAPKLGLASCIVDLVSSGATLKANGLCETDVIAEISSRLIVNRTAFKTRGREIAPMIDRAEQVVRGAAA